MGCGPGSSTSCAHSASISERRCHITKRLPFSGCEPIAEFNASKSGEPLVNRANILIERFDKDYPLKFYSRELLFSDQARATYVDGDLV